MLCGDRASVFIPCNMERGRGAGLSWYRWIRLLLFMPLADAMFAMSLYCLDEDAASARMKGESSLTEFDPMTE